MLGPLGLDLALLPHSPSSTSIKTYQEVHDDPQIDVKQWKSSGRKDGQNAITATYCKILVLLGLCFSLSETLTDKIPSGYYAIFYVYLVLGSLFFLIFVYVDIFRYKKLTAAHKRNSWILDLKRNLFSGTGCRISTIVNRRRSVIGVDDDDIPRPKNVYGSLYLRFGAVSKLN